MPAVNHLHLINDIIDEDVLNIIAHQADWHLLKEKSVLITGANGMLPSYMVYTLLGLNDVSGLNCKIIALVRSLDVAAIKYGPLMHRPDLIIIEQDVCDDLNYDGDIDYIIHAASQASPKYYHTDPVGTLNANVLGLDKLLNLARRQKVESFLFFSSSEVYGEPVNKGTGITEDDYGYLDITDIRACYAESKRLGETMCYSWCHQYGIPVKVIRPFHTYGPGMSLNDGRVFADFVANVHQCKNIEIKSKGDALRCFCYISDAVLAYFLILLGGKNGEAYNIGNPAAEASVADLAKIMVNIFPDRHLKVVFSTNDRGEGYSASKVNRIKPNIDKINNETKWKPEIGLIEGFKRTILSYEQ